MPSSMALLAHPPFLPPAPHPTPLSPGDTWDLRGLQVDGQPVTRAVAAAWLEAVYAGAHRTRCACG